MRADVDRWVGSLDFLTGQFAPEGFDFVVYGNDPRVRYLSERFALVPVSGSIGCWFELIHLREMSAPMPNDMPLKG